MTTHDIANARSCAIMNRIERFSKTKRLRATVRGVALGLLCCGSVFAQTNATIYGSTGLWKVFAADTLNRGRTSIAVAYDRVHRNPGDLTIDGATISAATGLTRRLEFGFAVEVHKKIGVGRQEQLSFGQQALGFFGDRTPGSTPNPEELVEGSSRLPQLRTPPAPEGRLSGAAGYYNLLPFAGFVQEGAGVGSATLAFKYNLLSESSGAPLGLAARAHFDIPIRKGIDYLLRHPVGTGDLQFGFNAILSRTVQDVAGLYWNVGYRHVDQPVHVSIVRLADELPLGFGWNIPRAARVEFIGEATVEALSGSHTPNTTFGSADPADLTLGVRIGTFQGLIVSGGYRRRLNKPEGARNGLVVLASFTSKP